MRITRLRTEVVHLPLKKPILSAIFEIRSADCVLVFLESDQGIVGEGLVFSINNRRLEVIHAMVRSLEPLVVGLDPTDAGAFHARAWKEINFLSHEGVSIVGLAGIENALLDLRGKAAGLNVARLLGRCRAAVPAYASGGLWLSSSIDDLQREAADFVAQGFRAVKMRLGKPDPDEDIARVRAVRQAIGPKIRLMADANQQLDVAQAIRLGRRLEEFNLTWFEEPVPYWNHAGEAEIAAALDTPIASGETVHTHRGIHAMLQRRSADVLMPDLQRMGGPAEFIKAGHLAEAYDTPVSSHLFSEMSLALLAALPNATFLEHMPWFEAIYRERIELDADGNAMLPDRAGWGFSFDMDAVKRFGE